MKADNSQSGEEKAEKRAEKRAKMKKYRADVLYWLYIGLCVSLVVGALVIAFTNHGNAWLMTIGALAGMAIIAIAMVFLSINKGADSLGKSIESIAVLLACAVFFMSSWFMWLDSGILVTREGKGIVLYQGRGPVFIVPYTRKVYHLEDFTARAKVSLSLDDEGEVAWEAKSRLRFVANYDQSFSLLRQFRGVTPWKEAVQQLFQEQVNEYVTQNVDPNQSVIPKNMSFKLTPEQQEGFSRLGFSVEEITLREISRFIYREPEGEP